MEAQTKPKPLRGTRARAAVLSAGRARFVDNGYRRTSIEDIARHAGVSRPTVYAHFESKEDIFRTLVTDLHSEQLEGMRAAIAGSGDLRDRLNAALVARFGRFVELTSSSPRASELLDEGGRLCEDVISDAHGQTLRMLRQLLADGMEGGELDLERSGLSVGAAAAVIYDCSVGAKEDGEIKLPAYRRRLRQIVAALLDGLAAR